MQMRCWLQVVFVISFVGLEVFAAAHPRPIASSHNHRSYIRNPMPISAAASIVTAAVTATYSRPNVVSIKKLNVGAKCAALTLNISDEGHAGMLEYSLKDFATYSKAPVVGAVGYARNTLPRVRIDKLSYERLDVERRGFYSSLTLPDADGIVVRLLFLYAGNSQDSQEGLEYLLVITKSAQVDTFNAYLYKKDAPTDVEWKRFSFDETGIEDNIFEWKIISLLKRLMSLDVPSKNQRKGDFCDSKVEAAQQMLIGTSQSATQSYNYSTSATNIPQAKFFSLSSLPNDDRKVLKDGQTDTNYVVSLVKSGAKSILLIQAKNAKFTNDYRHTMLYESIAKVEIDFAKKLLPVLRYAGLRSMVKITVTLAESQNTVCSKLFFWYVICEDGGLAFFTSDVLWASDYTKKQSMQSNKNIKQFISLYRKRIKINKKS